MRLLLTLLALLNISLAAFATPDTTFVDEDYQQCAKKYATGYITYTRADTGLYRAECHDIETNKREAVLQVKHPDSTKYEGHFVSYFEDGKTASEGNYENGKKEGVWKHYYDNGNLWYEEVLSEGGVSELTAYYKNGELKHKETHNKHNFVKGKRYDEQGKKIKFIPFLELPKPGYSLNRYLVKNIQYPRESINSDIEGRVVVKFMVDTSGTVSKVRVLKRLSPQLDAAAVKAVTQMPQWKPGRRDGKLTSTTFYLPVKFKLE